MSEKDIIEDLQHFENLIEDHLGVDPFEFNPLPKAVELIQKQAAEIEALKARNLEAINLMGAAIFKVRDWISVADELPLVGESVLVCNAGEVIMANLNSDFLFECGAFRPTKVTHWQVLPEPQGGCVNEVEI